MDYIARYFGYMFFNAPAGYFVALWGPQFLEKKKSEGYRLNPDYNFWKFEKERGGDV